MKTRISDRSLKGRHILLVLLIGERQAHVKQIKLLKVLSLLLCHLIPVPIRQAGKTESQRGTTTTLKTHCLLATEPQVLSAWPQAASTQQGKKIEQDQAEGFIA